jgi:hypothetical protein
MRIWWRFVHGPYYLIVLPSVVLESSSTACARCR